MMKKIKSKIRLWQFNFKHRKIRAFMFIYHMTATDGRNVLGEAILAMETFFPPKELIFKQIKECWENSGISIANIVITYVYEFKNLYESHIYEQKSSQKEFQNKATVFDADKIVKEKRDA